MLFRIGNVKLPALIALIGVSALAQSPSQRPKPSYTYDCSMLPEPSQGCQSYNQMVDKQDSDVMSTLKTGETYVCFRPNADYFMVVNYSDPVLLKPLTSNPTVLRGVGVGTYSSFKEGILDSIEALGGQWTQLKSLGTPPVFSGKGLERGSPTTLTVSDTEVDYSTSYENIGKTKTVYTLQIRRSTLRFSETYIFPTSQSKTATSTESGFSGYCAEFRPASE